MTDEVVYLHQCPVDRTLAVASNIEITESYSGP